MKVMIIYPGAEWSVFDVAKGYENALAALGHEVHAFDFHHQYRFYRSFFNYLTEHLGMVFPPDATNLKASEAAIIEMVEFGPDVLLIVTGLGWHRRGYDFAYKLGIPAALIMTESPYMDKEQAVVAQKGHIKTVFTNDKVSVPAYQDICPTFYLPHSFDPARHYPHDVGPEFQRDVFFWGTLWRERAELLESLDLSAYNAKVGGAYTDKDKPDVLIGEVIENNDMVLWYSGAKVAINHHRRDKFGGGLVGAGEAYSLGPRAFQIAACGAFQLCDETRPELREVFGDSVATYSDAETLQTQLDYYLTHEAERVEMAQEARRRVQVCTFMERAKKIVLPALEKLVGEI